MPFGRWHSIQLNFVWQQEVMIARSKFGVWKYQHSPHQSMCFRMRFLFHYSDRFFIEALAQRLMWNPS